MPTLEEKTLSIESVSIFLGLDPPATRWSTTLSSEVNLPHAINFRALYGKNLVTKHPIIWGERNPRTHSFRVIIRRLQRVCVCVCVYHTHTHTHTHTHDRSARRFVQLNDSPFGVRPSRLVPSLHLAWRGRGFYLDTPPSPPGFAGATHAGGAAMANLSAPVFHI